MNILLVYPTKLDKDGKPIKYKKAFLPPLSLAILNSLTPAHHRVKVINDIVEDLDFSNSYDLIAITAMTSQIERAYQIADRFRSIGIKVIIGGIHATVLPHEAKEHADSIVIGEVDNLWEHILHDFENNRFKEFYQDTSFPDLQKLVIPKWDNMNFKIYPKPIGNKLPLMPIFTTRGCRFNCKFCSVGKFFGNTHRVKSIANVIKEIESINARDYFFVDDNITCNADYSRELFKALIPKKIRWFSQISTTVLRTPELIDLAAKSGCNSLLIGIESINSENLKSVNKGFNKTEEYEELFARLRKANIIPFPSIIFGFDNDAPEQFRKTVDFLMKNKIGYAIFWILTPLPGTDLFNEMNDEGRILETKWSTYDSSHVVFQPKNLTISDLYKNYWKACQEFFSFKNIVKRTFYNVSISAHPFNEFIENLFYQFYFKKKIDSYEHPLSGGISRVAHQDNSCGLLHPYT